MSDLTRSNFHNRHGEHVTPWLGAFFDGEVTGALREEIEAHLSICQECRAGLAELEELSDLLHYSPLPELQTSDAVFARQVIARLAKPEPPFWQRSLQAAWRFAPLFMFAAWAFMQAVGWATTGVMVGLAMIPGAGKAFEALVPMTTNSGSSWLAEFLRMSLLNSQAFEAVEQVSWLNPVGSSIFINLIFLVVLTGLFASWLASWWVYQARRKVESV